MDYQFDFFKDNLYVPDYMDKWLTEKTGNDYNLCSMECFTELELKQILYEHQVPERLHSIILRASKRSQYFILESNVKNYLKYSGINDITDTMMPTPVDRVEDTIKLYVNYFNQAMIQNNIILDDKPFLMATKFMSVDDYNLFITKEGLTIYPTGLSCYNKYLAFYYPDRFKFKNTTPSFLYSM